MPKGIPYEREPAFFPPPHCFRCGLITRMEVRDIPVCPLCQREMLGERTPITEDIDTLALLLYALFNHEAYRLMTYRESRRRHAFERANKNG